MGSPLKLIWKGLAAVALSALFAIGTASAADRCVGGLAAPCTTNFSTIQEAIDIAAASGDTIHINPGTYGENLVVDDKSITFTKLDGTVGDVIIDSGQTWNFYASTTSITVFVENMILDTAVNAETITGDVNIDFNDSQLNGTVQFTATGVFSNDIVIDNTDISSGNFLIDLGTAGNFETSGDVDFLTDGNYSFENGTSVSINGADIYTGMFFNNISGTIDVSNNNFYGPISGTTMTIGALSGLTVLDINNNVFESNYVSNGDIIAIIADSITTANINGNDFATDVTAPATLLQAGFITGGTVNFNNNEVLAGSHFDEMLNLSGPATFYIDSNTFLNEDTGTYTGFASFNSNVPVQFSGNDFLISESNSPRTLTVNSDNVILSGNNMPKVRVIGYPTNLTGNVLAGYDLNSLVATQAVIQENTFTSYGMDPDVADYTLHLGNSLEGYSVKNNTFIESDTNLFDNTEAGDATSIIDVASQGADSYYYNNTFLSNSDTTTALNLGGAIVTDTYFKNNVFVNNGGKKTDVVEVSPSFVNCGEDASGGVVYEHNYTHGGSGPSTLDCAVTYGGDGPLSSSHINYETDPDADIGTSNHYVLLHSGTISVIGTNSIVDADGLLVPDAFTGKLLKLFTSSNDLEYYFYIEGNDEDEIFIMDDNIDLVSIAPLHSGVTTYYEVSDQLDLATESPFLESGLENASDSEVPLLDQLENPRLWATDRGAIESQTVPASNTAPVISNAEFNTETNTISWSFSDADLDDQLGFSIIVDDGTSYTATPTGLSTTPQVDEYKHFDGDSSFDFLDLEDALMLEPNTLYNASIVSFDAHDAQSNVLPLVFTSGAEILPFPTPDYYQIDADTHVINFVEPSGYDETTEVALVINQGTDINYPVSPDYDTCIDPNTLTITACDFGDLAGIPRDTLANWGENFEVTIPYLEGTYYVHVIGFDNGTDDVSYAMTASEVYAIRGVQLTNSDYDFTISLDSVDVTETPSTLYVQCRHEAYFNASVDNRFATLTSTLGDIETVSIDDTDLDSFLRGTINVSASSSATPANGVLEVADGDTIGLSCDVSEVSELSVFDNFEGYLDTAELEMEWMSLNLVGDINLSLETDSTQYIRNTVDLDNGDSGAINLSRQISEADYCDAGFKADIRVNDISLIADDPILYVDQMISDLVFVILDTDFDVMFQEVSKELLEENEFVEITFDDISTESLGGGAGFDCDQVIGIQLMLIVDNDTGEEQTLTIDVDNITPIETFSINLLNSVVANDTSSGNDGGSGSTNTGGDDDEDDDDSDDDDQEEDEGEKNGDDEEEDQDDDDQGDDDGEKVGDDEDQDEEEESEDDDSDDDDQEEDEDDSGGNFRSSSEDSDTGGNLSVVRTSRNIDTDNDGCADELEERYGSNPNKANSIVDGVSDCDVIHLYDGQTDLGNDFITVNAGTYPDYEFVINGAVNFAEGSAFGSTVEFKVIDDDNFTINLGSVPVQENNLYIKLNQTELKDGTYILVATTKNPAGEVITDSDTLVIDSDKEASLSLLNFSGIEFKDNKPAKSKKDNVLEISEKAFAYGKAPRDSAVRAYWNSVLLTSVSLSDTSEGTFYVEPRSELSTDEIHTLILVAENSDNPDIKSKPLVIKFRVNEGVSTQAAGLMILVVLLILGSLFILRRKKPEPVNMLVQESVSDNNFNQFIN